MYYFTPPTVTHRYGTHPLWGRMNHARGQAVVVYASGSISTLEAGPAIDGDTVTARYDSGRRYEITDAEATVLSDAGYGAYLEEVA